MRNGEVKTGIDQLEERNFDALKVPGVAKPRVGLVTNQTGVDSQGRRTIDVLAHAPQVQLTAIFSPGARSAGHCRYHRHREFEGRATGVPVYSVYGDSDAKRRPSPEQIRKLDVLVFDIQDAGARFYTYETTLGYFLEAAAKAGKPIVVLDRPNPLNGAYVQGPVSDAMQESFVNYHTVASATRYDDWRVGEAVQRRAAHQRQPHGGSDEGLDARRLVRFDRVASGSTRRPICAVWSRRRCIRAWP